MAGHRDQQAGHMEPLAPGPDSDPALLAVCADLRQRFELADSEIGAGG